MKTMEKTINSAPYGVFKKKGIYLASYKANHPNHHIIYQDINGKRDLGGDMMDIDLNPYDFIIATPPCNYYSKANYRRETSEYSQKTKHLLPSILKKLYEEFFDKPFIVENVINNSLIPHDYDDKLFVYKAGGHTYWSNVLINVSDLEFEKQNKQNVWRGKRQGGINVHLVIEKFIQTVCSNNYTMLKKVND